MKDKEIENFRIWLISSQKLQRRSAGDIISRRKKLLSIIQDPTTLSIDQVKALLEEAVIRGQFSRATFNGMIRAENFFRKFENDYSI
jgi:hypothetical protein